jgi:hypothetical protein
VEVVEDRCREKCCSIEKEAIYRMDEYLGIEDKEGEDRQSRKRLLSLLNRNPRLARQEYVQLHRSLVKFFETKGSLHAHQLANKTLFIAGNELVDEKIRPFTLSVARKVFKELTQEDFERLLSRLDKDPNQAAILYQSIQNRLIEFYGNCKCLNAEQLADRTLDIVSRKLKSEDILNIPGFAIGIAKMVVRERGRAPDEISFEEWQGAPNAAEGSHRWQEIDDSSDEGDLLLDCLEECLQELDKDRLSVTYFSTEGEKAKDVRKRLARSIGKTIKTLRVKMTRKRKDLEKCVLQRLKRRRTNAPAV